MSSSRLTIVIVTHNSADVLGDCLASIALHAPDAPVVVVDNSSEDGTSRGVPTSPFIKLIEAGGNLGFSKANNLALRETQTEFALVLNPDARLTSSTLPGLLAAADRHARGSAFGPRTSYEDGRPQVSFGPDLALLSELRQRRLVRGVKAGDEKALEAFRELSATEREVDWVSGSCLLLRMSAARAVDFFDERYFLYEEDADLCLRLRRNGGAVFFVPDALVLHGLGTSMAKAADRARAAYDQSHRLYYRLHRSFLERLLLEIAIGLGRR